MKYMLLLYVDEALWNALPEERVQAIMADYRAYEKEMREAGVMLDGSELAPVHTATTLRRRGNKLERTDGPFAETREQFGGYFLIDVPSMDEAVAWTSKCPALSHDCSVEIRPLMG
jgi:hypothetical protein